MRRVTSLVLCALAFVAAASGMAQADDTTTTTAGPTTTIKPTTTTAPIAVPTTAPTGGTTTTTKPGTAATTTSTTAKGGTGKPVPPPPSGASQPLDPSILGGTPLVDTSTTLFGVETVTVPQPSQVSDDPNVTVAAASSKKGPNGTTLVLAAVAWLASLGGLLVYAEDQRGLRWRHLAR